MILGRRVTYTALAAALIAAVLLLATPAWSEDTSGKKSSKDAKEATSEKESEKDKDSGRTKETTETSLDKVKKRTSGSERTEEKKTEEGSEEAKKKTSESQRTKEAADDEGAERAESRRSGNRNDERNRNRANNNNDRNNNDNNRNRRGGRGGRGGDAGRIDCSQILGTPNEENLTAFAQYDIDLVQNCIIERNDVPFGPDPFPPFFDDFDDFDNLDDFEENFLEELENLEEDDEELARLIEELEDDDEEIIFVEDPDGDVLDTSAISKLPNTGGPNLPGVALIASLALFGAGAGVSLWRLAGRRSG